MTSGCDELRPRGELDAFSALAQCAKARGEGKEAGGGAGEGGNPAGHRRGAFDNLLGRCVRLPQLGSIELATEVMQEPAFQGATLGPMGLVLRVMKELFVE